MIREAFSTIGYKLKAGFFRWVRSIEEAKNSKEYIGYYTKYYSPEVEKNFYFSDPIWFAPVGFVEIKYNPMNWENFDDLKTTRLASLMDM